MNNALIPHFNSGSPQTATTVGYCTL